MSAQREDKRENGRNILIVGGVAGGASAAARLRRNSEADRIIMFEKGPHVSFSNCSLPYYLSGEIEDSEDLVLMDPELFLKQYNIEARISQEVMAIDREKKTITVKNLASGESYTESYDKLILSPGAAPIVPAISGSDQVNLFTVRNVVDIERLHQYLKAVPSMEVAVIGGGFIGVEVAENLRKAEYKVALIEGTNQILRPYDYDMVQILHKEISDNGVELIIEDTVSGFEKDTVVLSSGRRITAGAVVMAVGVAPETRLAVEAGLELGETKAIKVNSDFQTSDPDIYAVGDAIEVSNALNNKGMKLSLAGPALKEARRAADSINGRKHKELSFIGSSAIKVFDLNAAATGLNEAQIKALEPKLTYNFVRIILNDKVGLMPDASPLHFKLFFEVPSGQILGAQAIGKGDVTKRIDVIAAAMKFGGTVGDLTELELSYAPPFSTAKDIVNYAGYVGSNLLNGDYLQVNVDEVRELLEKGNLIIDVREKGEYARGHIKGAINIPLSELRERVSEIPKDRAVYLHCRTGQRSYNAAKALQNLGYRDVYNITGSFLGLSYYEYFNDKRLNREKIVTEYNFR